LAELQELRHLTHHHGGYCTILRAPVALKQALSPWDRSVMPLGLMTQIKQRFDPENRLSPQRFPRVESAEQKEGNA
jgi:glycolate oxidase FAD binding subunit